MYVGEVEQSSGTETQRFRECGRRWYLANERGLVHKVERKELWFGDLMHSALQVYADKGVKAAVKAFKQLFEFSLPDVKKSYGGLWEGVEEMYLEFEELGIGMLQNYPLFAESQGMEMDTIQLEQRVWVPILDLNGKPTNTKLTARMDRIVGIKDELYIVDYKTGASASTGKAFELNDQVTGYCYVYYRMTEELPAGVIFEHLMKKLPEEPRMIKNDSELSTAKNQNTLPQLYYEKMKELKLLRSAKHVECYEALLAQGWDGYFEREMTQRNIQQVLGFEEHLYFIYRDMVAVIKDPRKAYPNPSSMRCPRCPFLNVCLAMEDDSDAEHLIEVAYHVNT